MNVTSSEHNGFLVFSEFNAISLHFKSKSYDFFKYQGKTRTNIETFLKRKDRHYFFKLSRKYSLEDVRYFFVANMVYRDTNWIGNMMDNEGEEAFKLWQKNNQSLQYRFKSDIMNLLDRYDNPESMLKVEDGQHPQLLEDALGKEVMVETLSILNDLMGFFKAWDKKINDDVIWPEYRMKCLKYTPFISYDKVKFKDTLKELL